MAKIIEISNPFEPWNDTHTEEFKKRITIRTYLRKRHGPEFKEFEKPTIILVNGKGVKRNKWDRLVLKKHDIVNIITLRVGFPIILIALLVIALVAVVIALKTQKKPNMANVTGNGSLPAADPVYTLKGQSNQHKLGAPIEVPYGLVRMYPSYAADPYTTYKNNDQWVYQLLCLGQGEFDIATINIENTPIGDYTDVQYEVTGPGGIVTLFPDNVITSVGVSSIELLGPNQGGYAWSGPFIVCGVGKQTTKIECDVNLPNGLYSANNNGSLSGFQVTINFQAQEIDNSGTPIGAWFDITNFDQTLATTTPQRFTLESTVASGRYQVRAQRTNNRSGVTTVSDQANWEQLRAYLPSITSFGNVTMLAVAARASNNLNGNSQNRVNVIGTRMLPAWDKTSQSWLPAAPTRSIVWAFCDVFRAAYGGQLADKYLDLDNLADLDVIFGDRGEYFDWIFDQRSTVWGAAQTISRVGRGVPMINGSLITIIRDQPQTLPSAIFNQENIIKGSFKRQIKFSTVLDNDGVEVTYTDPSTYLPETVLCLVGAEEGNDPEQVTLEGCANRDIAWRYGMYYRRLALLATENIIFKTGLEGHIPSFGDLIGLNYDVPKWGQGGFVVSIAALVCKLSEPVTFVGGHTMYIGFRDRHGNTVGPFVVTAGVDNKHVVLPGGTDTSMLCFDDDKEAPLFLFGAGTPWVKTGRISLLAPASDDTVEVTAVNYDGDVFADDSNFAPAIGNTNGNLGSAPNLPSVTGLKVLPATNQPGMVIASWNPSAGAQLYVVQYSYDSYKWHTVATTIDTSVVFPVAPSYLYVRVAAFNTAQGPFANWEGNAPVPGSNIVIDPGLTPNPVTSVVTTGGFNSIWLTFILPTNVPIKSVHIYAANINTQPLVPTYKVNSPLTFFVEDGLPSAQTRYYWLVCESVKGGVFSTVVGPITGATIAGISLADLVPGMTMVEIVTSLPAINNFKGRTVFLTTNSKLYKWTNPSVSTGTTYWDNKVDGGDIIADTIVVGALSAGAVTAYAVGTNEIIADTANIKDGIISNAKIIDATISNAKIVSLLADKILAGTISAAVAMEAPLLATVGACYHSGNQGSTFPTAATTGGSAGGGSTGLTAGTVYACGTIYGWDLQSGYNLNSFGKTDMVFTMRVWAQVNFSGGGPISFTPVYRINGGAWVDFSSGFAKATCLSGSGNGNVAADLEISGLASTDYIDFGFGVGGAGTYTGWGVFVGVVAYNF